MIEWEINHNRVPVHVSCTEIHSVCYDSKVFYCPVCKEDIDPLTLAIWMKVSDIPKRLMKEKNVKHSCIEIDGSVKRGMILD